MSEKKQGEEFPPGVEVLAEMEKVSDVTENPFKKVNKNKKKINIKIITLIKIGKSNKSNLSKRESKKQRNLRRNSI
jgi:hypothetical protein